MNRKLNLLALFSAVFLISCKDQNEIKQTIESVYHQPDLSPSQDLSDELIALMDSVQHSRKVLGKAPKKTKSSVLTGHNEGYTSYQISQIGISYNQATALISFKDAVHNFEWIDTVKLVYQKRWRLDDVHYNKLNNPRKSTLKERIISC